MLRREQFKRIVQENKKMIHERRKKGDLIEQTNKELSVQHNEIQEYKRMKNAYMIQKNTEVAQVRKM